MVIAILIVAAGIVIVLAAEVSADRHGESRRTGRLARLAILLLGCGAIYWLLVAR